MKLRTPVKHARGLGSARDGTAHWWAQRLSALALIPLGIWLMASLIALLQVDYATARDWVGDPLNALLLVVTLGTLFYHSWLGVQVVVEDYVHGKSSKLVTLVISQFLHILFAALGIFAVLRIAFGA